MRILIYSMKLYRHCEMYFLSFLVRITTLITSLFISPFQPYILTKVAIPNYSNKYALDHKIYLSYSDGKRVDITQPAGTKYSYLPSDFQADRYIIVSQSDGTETTIKDSIPTINMRIQRKIRRSVLD